MARVYAIVLGILGTLSTLLGIGGIAYVIRQANNADLAGIIAVPLVLSSSLGTILIGTTWITSAVIITILRGIEDQQRHTTRLHLAGQDDRADLDWAA